MFLKSLTISNFRKFSNTNNTIKFSQGVDPIKSEEDGNNTLINIAPKTTLVVGKNNSGKTTIINALDILVNSTSTFTADDFNINYLKDLLRNVYCKENQESIKNNLPYMEFIVTVGLEDERITDILTELYQVLSISNVSNRECHIKVKYEISETEHFIKKIISLIDSIENQQEIKFDKFKKIINETEFSLNYYNEQNEKITNFKLSNLIELKYIKANNVRDDNCLTNAFSKIVEYQYNNAKENEMTPEMDNQIDEINSKLSIYMKENHTDSLNKIMKRVINENKAQVLLKSNLTVKSLLTNVIKYYFIEKENEIPETQFGLGFTNLIMIIAEILQYMEKYPDLSFNSQINLIAIEEPETFMHPQMQETFINKINEIVSDLLSIKHKNINSQLIITTHSSYILNSKIQTGNTFNNINYIKEKNCYTFVTPLDDSKISNLTQVQLKELEKLKNKSEDNDENVQAREEYFNFEFIKKHIIFDISNIFFADAIIFVEGDCEYNLLKYFIQKDIDLNKFFISIVLIDGAHAKMYRNLINVIGIPTLIITDIDINREAKEKGVKYKEKGKDCVGDYVQIESLDGRYTTNNTIKEFMKEQGKYNLKDYDYYEKDNLKIVFQRRIGKIYPTSFEESFILTNKDSDELKDILREIKPCIFDEIESNGGIEKNSFKWQCKLSQDKTKFANKIIYEEIKQNKQIFTIPEYILDGLGFLKGKLKE